LGLAAGLSSLALPLLNRGRSSLTGSPLGGVRGGRALEDCDMTEDITQRDLSDKDDADLPLEERAELKRRFVEFVGRLRGTSPRAPKIKRKKRVAAWTPKPASRETGKL